VYIKSSHILCIENYVGLHLISCQVGDFVLIRGINLDGWFEPKAGQMPLS